MHILKGLTLESNGTRIYSNLKVAYCKASCISFGKTDLCHMVVTH